MKQLVPSGLDEYIAEHKEGNVVTGRIIEISDGQARVELGEGIHASCQINEANAAAEKAIDAVSSSSKPDLSSLGSMLQARWKGVTRGGEAKSEPIHAGQVRNFTITRLDAGAKKIELRLA